MTKRETEVFEAGDVAAFVAAQKGQRAPHKAAKDARPDIPRAPAGAGDQHNALMRLAVYGISMRFDAGVGFYGWNASTGWKGSASEEYSTAIALAEQEAKQ